MMTSQTRKLINVDLMLESSVHTGPAFQHFLVTFRDRPSKSSTFIQCWFDAGPPSRTLVQHQISVGLAYLVCWMCVHC